MTESTVTVNDRWVVVAPSSTVTVTVALPDCWASGWKVRLRVWLGAVPVRALTVGSASSVWLFDTAVMVRVWFSPTWPSLMPVTATTFAAASSESSTSEMTSSLGGELTLWLLAERFGGLIAA